MFQLQLACPLLQLRPCRARLMRKAQDAPFHLPSPAPVQLHWASTAAACPVGGPVVRMALQLAVARVEEPTRFSSSQMGPSPPACARCHRHAALCLSPLPCLACSWSLMSYQGRCSRASKLWAQQVHWGQDYRPCPVSLLLAWVNCFRLHRPSGMAAACRPSPPVARTRAAQDVAHPGA